MRILGIDYGEKRIGLAVSDELQLLARELKIVNPKVFWEELAQIITEFEISTIVIGLPLNMSGEYTAKTQEVEQFKIKVGEVSGLPTILVDERLSSQMASTVLDSQKNLDSLAAQIILQNYLNLPKAG